MNRIWANRLEEGAQVWADCPLGRRAAVREILLADVAAGKLSEERFCEIVGEPYNDATAEDYEAALERLGVEI